MPKTLFYLKLFGCPISNKKDVWLVFLLLQYFIETPVFNAKVVDPAQTPRSAASDLGLHSLPMTFKGR